MLWNSDPVSNTQSDYPLFNLQHSIFLFNDLLFFLVFIEHVYAIFLWFDSDGRERNWETKATAFWVTEDNQKWSISS